MTEQSKILEFTDFGQGGLDAFGRSFDELNKGLQAIAAEWTDYSKKTFEDSTKAFEKLVGAKSPEKVFEIQSQFAKKAFEDYVAELAKVGEMYASLVQSTVKVR
jgi:hypothetical protein